MKYSAKLLSSLFLLPLLLASGRAEGTLAPAAADPRLLNQGWIIPSEGYSDQPYIVKADDGAWVCIVTTGKGREGATGQHVVSLRSTDLGRTWEDIVPIEPADGPEASYGVLLMVPGGRLYDF